jgi:peptidoglycan/LPS O-acetylase OafA/YrhL
MGIYRLALAIVVALAHLGFGGNIGVSAVVSFFLISGYVMTGLVDRHYSTPSRLPGFYIDRAMRLFPQFLFYILLTLILIAIAHPSSPFISGVSAKKIALNVAMLPLNFYWHFFDSMIIPQAWSLGLESQFYLVMPMIIMLRARSTIFVASIAFFLLPYFGILNGDIWGYRMLPGTLFMFLFGSFLSRRTNTQALVIAYAIICGLFAYVATHTSMQHPYTMDVLSGLVFGIPALWALSNIRPRMIDQIAGNISYGVFLNHFFLIWLFQSMGISDDSSWYLCLLIGTSVALSALSYYFVERPVVGLRHAIRNRSVQPTGSGGVSANHSLG